MRYLGIDYGTKRIGVALSDENGTMGFPHAIVPATKDALNELVKIATDAHVEALVMGESLQLDGAENAVAKQARALGEGLSHRLNIPLHFEPEMFTSAEARRAPHKLAPREDVTSPEAVDASAAAIILTSFLSHHHE